MDQNSQEAGPNGLQDPRTQGSLRSVQSVTSGRGFVQLSQESQKATSQM